MKMLLIDKYFLLVLLNYEASGYRTLVKMSKVSYKDSESLITTLIAILRLKSDQYHNSSISEIVFKFKLVPEDQESQSSIIHAPKNPEVFNPDIISVGEYRLPSTMNFVKWGELV